ncbi:LysR substrate-binding domain-containing protein [Aureimonas psammosilenae]|uniref:LysR substrate-binding domain-containing protein n=1 Tax=Aureimonas psammosilenae TaxID=2495496 RepID=UPI0022A6CB03|nr:LysR substrate-binding domain-containing protein [Aureimonas psammosilenae]
MDRDESLNVLASRLTGDSRDVGAGNVEIGEAAVLAGIGLSVLSDFVVAGGLKAGRLTPVLPDWQLPVGGIHAVFPSARFRPTRVSAFVDLLATAIKSGAAGTSRSIPTGGQDPSAL